MLSFSFTRQNPWLCTIRYIRPANCSGFIWIVQIFNFQDNSKSRHPYFWNFTLETKICEKSYKCTSPFSIHYRLYTCIYISKYFASIILMASLLLFFFLRPLLDASPEPSRVDRGPKRPTAKFVPLFRFQMLASMYNWNIFWEYRPLCSIRAHIKVRKRKWLTTCWQTFSGKAFTHAGKCKSLFRGKTVRMVSLNTFDIISFVTLYLLSTQWLNQLWLPMRCREDPNFGVNSSRYSTHCDLKTKRNITNFKSSLLNI